MGKSRHHFVFILAGAALLGSATLGSAQELKPFKVLTSNNAACSIFAQHVAAQLGFYEDEGSTWSFSLRTRRSLTLLSCRMATPIS